jgi:hypothetical protein
MAQDAVLFVAKALKYRRFSMRPWRRWGQWRLPGNGWMRLPCLPVHHPLTHSKIWTNGFVFTQKTYQEGTLKTMELASRIRGALKPAS